MEPTPDRDARAGLGERTFVDVHCHLFNLSHPGFTGFLDQRLEHSPARIFIEPFQRLLGRAIEARHVGLVSLWLMALVVATPFLLLAAGCIGLWKITALVHVARRLINSLYLMETDIADQLLMVERDFLSLDDRLRTTRLDYFDDERMQRATLAERSAFARQAAELFRATPSIRARIRGREYDTVILTPLVMDFGRRYNRQIKTHYSYSSQKSLEAQVIDLFSGIKRYLAQSPFQVFEIYPFLGLNPPDFTSPERLTDFLGRVFVLDERARYAQLKQCFERTLRDGDLAITIRRDGAITMSGTDTGYLAGIKLYPPLGFDPWPEDPAALEKTRALYDFCDDHQVPITVHFQELAFQTASRATRVTDPQKFVRVFEALRDKHQNAGSPMRLRVNFAHLGLKNRSNQYEESKWTDTIIQLMQRYPQNVYTDVAAMVFNPSLESKLTDLQRRCPALKTNLLFGSDFPVSMLWVDSYRDYLAAFFDLAEKHPDYYRTCAPNALRFLFGTEEPKRDRGRERGREAQIGR